MEDKNDILVTLKELEGEWLRMAFRHAEERTALIDERSLLLVKARVAGVKPAAVGAVLDMTPQMTGRAMRDAERREDGAIEDMVHKLTRDDPPPS